MLVIAPDVLAQARGLSPVLSSIGIVIGGLLWLFGWRWHRFWVVLAVTLCGGIIGLQTGKTSGGHILAMGVLLALSAGLLALEIARIIAFLASGTAVWLAAAALFPRGQELWVAFLIGGLLGVLLYRFWTMLATSFVAVLIGWHSLLWLSESIFKKFDAAAFAQNNGLILNGAVLVASILGMATQSTLERWYLRFMSRWKKRKEEQLKQKIIASAPKPSMPPIWKRMLGLKK